MPTLGENYTLKATDRTTRWLFLSSSYLVHTHHAWNLQWWCSAWTAVSVFPQGFLFNTCINEEILLLGLGRTAPLHGLDPHSRLYWRLHARLLKCELRAERKGRGIWKRESLREKVAQAVRSNTTITAMKRIMKWVLRRTWSWGLIIHAYLWTITDIRDVQFSSKICFLVVLFKMNIEPVTFPCFLILRWEWNLTVQ